MSLGLLGGFELRLGEQIVPLPMTAQRLLVFLALRRHRLTRRFVSQCLWLDSTERHADGNLRTALWRIGGVDAALIDMTGGYLGLGPSVEVDFHRSAALAQRLSADPESFDDSEFNVSMLSEELLPDWYEEWVFAERENYRQLRLHALESLCERLMSIGQFGSAIQGALVAVAGEPLRESANLLLIRAHLAEGNVSEALRHYHSFRSLLRKELGVSPSSETTDVIAPYVAVTAS